MAIKSISISLFTSCLLIVSANSSAYFNKIDDRSITTERLVEFYETSAVADKIWDRLTSDFVAQYESGDYAQAAVTARTAYSLAENVYGPDDINTADSMLKMGIISETLGDLDQAKEYMLGALVVLEGQLQPYHEDVAVVLTNLANVYFEAKQPQKSEEYHTRALEIRKRIFGDNHPTVAQSIYNLAVLYDELEDYNKASILYKQALAIWKVSFGTEHPYIANALNNLANVYMLKGEYAASIELHKRSLAARRKLYGDVHPEVARSLINLGSVYVKNQSYDLAKPLYVEAVSVAEKLFGKDHPQVAMLLYSLANIYHIQGRMQASDNSQQDNNGDTADASIKPVKYIVNKNSKADENANQKKDIAKSYYIKAVPLYERALAILDGSIGKDHPAVSAMLNELAILYRSIGNDNKAEQMLARLSEFHDVVDVHTKR